MPRDSKCTTETTDDGRVIERLVRTSDGFVRGERILKEGRLVKEEWWKGAERVGWVEPTEVEQEEKYQGFSGGRLVAEGKMRPELHGSPIGVWSVLEDGKVIGEAPFERLNGLTFMHVDRDELPSFAERLMRWAQAPVPAALADIIALDWSKRWGWFAPDEKALQLPFIVSGLLFNDDVVFEKCLGQLGADAATQGALSAAAAPILSAMFRALPSLPKQRQEKLVRELQICWEEASKHLGKLEAIGGGTLLDLFRTRRELLDQLTRGSTDAELQENGARLVKAIDASTKAAELAVILDRGEDVLLRCETILALHQHPELTVEDYLQMLADPEDDPLFRFVASYFFITRFMKARRPEPIEVLIAASDQLGTLSERFAKLSFAGPGLVVYLTRSYNFIFHRTAECERARACIPKLLEAFDTVSDKRRFVEELLGITFGDCTPPFAPSMIDVLERIASLPDLGPFRRSLLNFGLVADSGQLKALIEQLRKSEKPDADLRAYMLSAT